MWALVWALLEAHLGLQKPSVSLTTIPAGFYSQVLWGIFFLALQAWTEVPGVGLRPLVFQGRTSTIEISFWIHVCHT